MGTQFAITSNSGLLRAMLVVQDATKEKTLAWKAFGQRAIDGYFYGTLTSDGQGFANSQNVAYVYENFEIALVGKFSESKLIRGTPMKIERQRCKNGMMEIDFVPFENKQPNLTFFDMTAIQKQESKKMDPLDKWNVRVASSQVSNEAGLGLFATKDLGIGSIIALYSGLLISNATQVLQAGGNSVQRTEHLHRYMLAFNQTHTIDVPSHYDGYYRATLGHRANHSFNNSNARFGFVKTPR